MRSIIKLQPILHRFAAALAVAALMFSLAPAPAQAQSAGSCEIGSAQEDLDANNVRARIFNAGNLFWKGSGFVYTVPKAGSASSIFAAGIWLGGLVNGEQRFAGTTYSPFEYWPGPLDANGNPPADCGVYDRIYNVTTEDLDRYESTGQATADMLEWPHELGAPVVDGDGNPNNYNLAGGDRPEVLGNQTLWWIMNDVGNVKGWSETPPIGMEVQATAFSYRRADDLNNTTFYRYKLVYKGDAPFEEAYFGLFVDPDVGNALDDFVGVDSVLGLGFAYNGDDFDEGGVTGYGDRPPAVGVDFFQGPLVPSPGEDWTDPDGTVYEDQTRLPMTHFHYWDNAPDPPYGSPDGSAGDGYRYLQSIWRDGEPVTEGGIGYNPGTNNPEVNFVFPGDPVTQSFWSEENTDGQGARNTPYDRRFLVSTGPFTMNPGDAQEIVFGIVWARAADRLGSVTALRQADVLAQNAFDENFELPPPPPSPNVEASSFDETIVLTWGYEPNSPNYLESYEVVNPFIVGTGVDDTTYTFEGYNVYRYESELFDATTRELVATYDVINGVTTVTDIGFDNGIPITEVTLRGSDSGIQKSIAFENLTNYEEYYFGVQAFAYNEFSAPKVFYGPVARVTAEPISIAGRGGGTIAATDSLGIDIAGVPAEGTLGDGTVGVTVVDPLKVTGDTYSVEFYIGELSDGTEVTSYNIINSTTGEVVFDGDEVIAITGEAPATIVPGTPASQELVVIDGLAFKIVDAPPAIASIEEVMYAGEDVANDATEFPGNTVFYALATGNYIIGATAATNDISRLERFVDFAAPRDFEFRFTDEGGLAVYAFEDDKIASVPFEIWDIGIGTYDDPSDDVRMIPFIISADGVTDATWQYSEVEGPFGFYGHSDAVYWMDPVETDGYAQFEATAEAAGGPGSIYPFDTDGSRDGYFADFYGGFVYPIGRWVVVDLTNTRDSEPPPSGTTVRVYTTKPFQPDDAFTVNTEGVGLVEDDPEVAEANLDAIGIVPNPYKGASSYELGPRRDVVKFTNLPDMANIKVFSLAGTLVWDETLGTFNNEWDLQTNEGLSIASGLYLIHVEVPGVGETILKFGVVTSRVQLDLL